MLNGEAYRRESCSLLELSLPTYNNYCLKMSKNRNTKDILLFCSTLILLISCFLLKVHFQSTDLAVFK